MNISFISRVHRLRWKYKNNDDFYHSSILDKILWYSVPIVYTNNEFLHFTKEYNKLVSKRKRYKKYVRGMISTFEQVYLLTLTFNDDYYFSSSSLTKRHYCQRFLESICLDYFGSADFGKKTKREHYHFIVAFKPSVNLYYRDNFLIVDGWEYGFHNVKRIGSEGKDFHSVLNYSLKTAAYALKNTDGKTVKPFHKRGVIHYGILNNDNELF